MTRRIKLDSSFTAASMQMATTQQLRKTLSQAELFADDTIKCGGMQRVSTIITKPRTTKSTFFSTRVFLKQTVLKLTECDNTAFIYHLRQ